MDWITMFDSALISAVCTCSTRKIVLGAGLALIVLGVARWRLTLLNPALPGGRSRASQISECFNTAAFAKAAGIDGTAGWYSQSGRTQRKADRKFDAWLMSLLGLP